MSTVGQLWFDQGCDAFKRSFPRIAAEIRYLPAEPAANPKDEIQRTDLALLTNGRGVDVVYHIAATTYEPGLMQHPQMVR
jgi:hypothetical protein